MEQTKYCFFGTNPAPLAENILSERGGFLLMETKSHKPLKHLFVFFICGETRWDQASRNYAITYHLVKKLACSPVTVLKLSSSYIRQKEVSCKAPSDICVPGCPRPPCIHHNLHAKDHKEASEPVLVGVVTLISQENKLYLINSSIPKKLHPNWGGYIIFIVLI